jgi:agmatine deiminase
MSDTTNTKLSAAYRMPAEWEIHEATWIAWPHNRDDWPGKFEAIPWVYGEIVRQLHQAEEVRILVDGPSGEQAARAVLDRLPLSMVRVTFWHIRTDRVWTRDYGPAFVTAVDGSRTILNWAFNAWAKYDDWHNDNAVTEQIAQRLALPLCLPHLSERRVVLEGGSIEVNGAGLLLTTEECLLSEVQERNPGLEREQYEQLFARYLGVEKVLWLGQGLAGDDTHGHIDDLARFVAPRTIVTVVEDDSSDVNYRPLQENLERLRGMTDPQGRALDVVSLPMPRPVVLDGQRLPASYANFYIANDRVLMPTFNDANDRRALGVLAELFPGRTVVGIHAIDLVWGLGTLHCLTQQQPAGGAGA